MWLNCCVSRVYSDSMVLKSPKMSLYYLLVCYSGFIVIFMLTYCLKKSYNGTLVLYTSDLHIYEIIPNSTVMILNVTLLLFLQWMCAAQIILQWLMCLCCLYSILTRRLISYLWPIFLIEIYQKNWHSCKWSLESGQGAHISYITFVVSKWSYFLMYMLQTEFLSVWPLCVCLLLTVSC